MIESAAIMPYACLAIHDERVLSLDLEKLLANGLDATSRLSYPPRGCSVLLRKWSAVINVTNLLISGERQWPKANLNHNKITAALISIITSDALWTEKDC